ncbi:MAG: CHAT domain-containing protein [Cyanobacteriota bacterium]|nr:CHAT domain-containing protein [Cyanobacteriota bacterium]
MAESPGASPCASSWLPATPLRPAPLPALLSGVCREKAEAEATGSARGAMAEVPAAAGLLAPAFVRVEKAFRFGSSGRGEQRGGGTTVDPLAGMAADQVLLLEPDDGGVGLTTVAALRRARRREWRLEDDSADRDAGAAAVAGHLFSLRFADDGLIAEARQRLRAIAGERLLGEGREPGESGSSWLATRVLLQVIEERRPLPPGLYRWSGSTLTADQAVAADDGRLRRDAAQGMLVLVHGFGGSTDSSFGDLAAGPGDLWPVLAERFRGRIYAFEQHTVAASPIDNALALARSLPDGARLHLVSHGLGGLVSDLLCLDGIDEELIGRFQFRGPETGSLAAQLKAAQNDQQERLRDLRDVLERKAFRIERVVRVAAPARGSLLLGRRLDLYLSGLLTLIEALPGQADNPQVAVLRRLVLEIVRRHTHPGLVPGLAAMLPASPLVDLLARARPRAGLAMLTIAGDCDGDHPLRRLALLLGDALFFERCANDLVVDTSSMEAGIAPRAAAHVLREHGSGVTHLQIFRRAAPRRALLRWLTEPDPLAISAYRPLQTGGAQSERNRHRRDDEEEDRAAARSRGARLGSRQPVVVVLPGLLGSHLWVRAQRNRLWLDPVDLAWGALDRLRDIRDVRIEAEKLFDFSYGALCSELLRSHRVVRFAYDWRQPLDVLAERLAATLRPLLTDPEGEDQPVRLLAHSMGGLVVRAMIAREPELWRLLIIREGARFLMLGTPNQGSYQMVESLLGKSDLIRSLARFDLSMGLQEQLDVLAGFPGALQLLPRPGFEEPGPWPGPRGGGKGQPLQLPPDGWYDPTLWRAIKGRNRDAWLGDGLGALPEATLLKAGRWLWDQQAAEGPRIPGDHPDRVIFIHGQAANTPCGVALLPAQGDRTGSEEAEPLMLGTAEGDGSVTWRSGAIDGIGSFYLMDADHGGLPCRRRHFPALVQLLREGSTNLLPRVARLPALRSPQPIRPYEPGPAPLLSEQELLQALGGGGGDGDAADAAAPAVLAVGCHAMDLRYVSQPVMVGHYIQDPIAGAEALIDRAIVAGELSSRERLGLYAGPLGSATVVLMNRSQEELHHGRCRGAVVIGLGPLGELSAATLTEAVQAGTLRYLLQIVDRHGGGQVEPVDVGLATLLLGQNSSGAIGIEDSVAALVHGVLAANAQFARVFPHLSVRVGRLQIVEVFLDTAISATHALRRLAETLNGADGPRLELEDELQLGRGWRHRLDAAPASGYWPRLLVLGDPPESGGRPGGEADLLHFAFLGERARAETIDHPHQRSLVEALVAASIDKPLYNEDLARTLFQLLVPHAFKDMARRLDQLVLVLDGSTADLPWELLLADSHPLALSVAMVRQLQSPRYRLRVRPSPVRNACVIGNPSTSGFTEVFGGAAHGGDTGLPSLEGAAREAATVVRILDEHGWDVDASIEEPNGVDVINRLYRRPNRILHLAAHGVFEQATRDGERRSGVVLANGMVITAAEIEAMEVVPDLVFLNCCHLARVTGADGGDARVPPFHRLAASVARQLITMGVRAVVACGWAVDDRAAEVFAEAFYRAMLQNRPFGDALFRARRLTHEAAPESSTWGAYQGYGDPAYVLEPTHVGSGETAAAPPARASQPWRPVSLQELLEQLRQWDLRLADTAPGPAQQAALAELATLLRGVPAGWLRQAPVSIALADLHAGLGGAADDEACRLYREALAAHGGGDGLPLRAIARWAAVEARLGESRLEEEPIRSAQRRLESLISLCADGAAAVPTVQGRSGAGGEELGTVLRRLAVVRARRLLAEGRSAAAGQTRMLQALDAAIAAYGAVAEIDRLLPRLLLQGVRRQGGAVDPALTAAALALQEDLGVQPGLDGPPADGLARAEALLALRLLDGGLAAAGAPGEQAAAAVLDAFRSEFQTLPMLLRERCAALERLRALEDLLAARALARGSRAEASAACGVVAGRLASLRTTLAAEAGLGAAPGSPATADPAADGEESLEVLG